MARLVRAALLLSSLSGLMLTLGGCSQRSTESVVDDFVESWNDGSLVSDGEELVDGAGATQLEHLADVASRCPIEPSSVVIRDPGLTPQIDVFTARATCGGKHYLVGGTVFSDVVEDDVRSVLIDAHFLPGGTHAGEFSRDGLDQQDASLPALT